MKELRLDPDRLFSPEPTIRDIARSLYAGISHLPIVSPHGHTDPAWFAANAPFSDPASLLIVPDHYLLRMLHSQGVKFEELGIAPREGGTAPAQPRQIWRLFAKNYFLFRGTPSRLWLDWVFAEVFGMRERLSEHTADQYYDDLTAKLQEETFRPRALYDRFGIEVIATTEGPLDDLRNHRAIRESAWDGRVITTYRPDAVVDPDDPDFAKNLDRFGVVADEDVRTYGGYLAAHRKRRAFFRDMGATATDHGHPSAFTANLSRPEAEALYDEVRLGKADAASRELFRGQMLSEMAAMSVDDGMVMQLHVGAFRNHDQRVFQTFGRDKGADIPIQTEFVRALHPLLNRFGSSEGLTLIVFTLDEDTYSRELAPLAGYYPALKLGPPWWFHDSPEGMRRFRERTTETAGFHNMVGFNDDTRAFLSIPARHDLARRVDCDFLARLVGAHQLPHDEAAEIAHDLAYGLVKRAYKL